MIEHIDCLKELIWITLDGREGPFWARDKIRVLGSAWPCLCTFCSTSARQQGSLVSQTGGGFLFSLCVHFNFLYQIGGGFFFSLSLPFYFFFSNWNSVNEINRPFGFFKPKTDLIYLFLGWAFYPQVWLAVFKHISDLMKKGYPKDRRKKSKFLK